MSDHEKDPYGSAKQKPGREQMDNWANEGGAEGQEKKEKKGGMSAGVPRTDESKKYEEKDHEESAAERSEREDR